MRGLSSVTGLHGIYLVRDMSVGQTSSKQTYPANLCPIQCGGAARHSSPRSTILHNESAASKEICATTGHNTSEARPDEASWALSSEENSNEKKNERLSIGRWTLRLTANHT